MPAPAWQAAAAAREFVVRLEVDRAFPGGLAVYGERLSAFLRTHEELHYQTLKWHFANHLRPFAHGPR